MRKYCVVNNFTGEDYIVEFDPEHIEESRWFWSILGWSVLDVA